MITLILALTSMGALAEVDPNTSPEVVVTQDVAMKTRDGVTLRADIYRPVLRDAVPVLLQRTPYNKARSSTFARHAAMRGYLVVIQDVRGRYASEGEWYPFKNEINDGFDAVEWAAALPHTNGKVGMFGDSYVGATQLLAAISRPPHLAGICPIVTASNYHENWVYQGGAFQQWFDQSWVSSLSQESLLRLLKSQTNTLQATETVPLTEYPLFNVGPKQLNSAQMLAPYYVDWLQHPAYDDYWKQWAIDERYSSIDVPSLTVAAWYDLFLPGSLRNFEGMRAKAANDKARKDQRLIITLGGHAGWGRKIGSLDFGNLAAFDEDATILDWFDYLFKGTVNEFAANNPVSIFVMGENKWRSEDNWPLSRAVKTRYYLHSKGHANSRHGDGTLSFAQPTSDLPDSFAYDPADPVPTTGGPLCCEPEHLPPGPQDQQRVEERPDVLVYSTSPLDADMELTGPVSLELYASSSAVDTDFTGKLVDVWPNGFAQNLTEGVLRARFRDSTAEARPIAPGQVYKYTIDLVATSNVFLKGHRLRLEVSSSNFPRFDRNHNTGEAAASSSTFSTAKNSIYHDHVHPSALIVPVVPR